MFVIPLTQVTVINAVLDFTHVAQPECRRDKNQRNPNVGMLLESVDMVDVDSEQRAIILYPKGVTLVQRLSGKESTVPVMHWNVVLHHLPLVVGQMVVTAH